MEATLDFSWNMSQWTGDGSLHVAKVEKQILMDEHLVGTPKKDVWTKLQGLYSLLLSNNQKDLADDLLTTFLNTVPHTRRVEIAPESEFIWHFAQARPELPWESDKDREAAIAATAEKVAAAAKPEYNMENPGFWKMGDNWTSTDRIFNFFDEKGRLRGVCTTPMELIQANPNTELDYWIPESFTTLKQSYDLHEWRESSDSLTMAMCARLLCHAPEGDAPNQDNVKEAFQALQKQYTSSTDDNRASQFLEDNIYLLLAINLGERQAARDEVQRVLKHLIPNELHAGFSTTCIPRNLV